MDCYLPNKNKKMNKFFRALIISIVLFIVASPIMVSAVTIDNPLLDNNIWALLNRIIWYVASIVGALSVIMITVAGIMYLLSAGSPEKTNSAKKAFMYAIAGIVIAMLAGTIATIIWEIIGVRGS
ncbi:MAG: pilin [bacterium]|nr:pilin [bacterium]